MIIQSLLHVVMMIAFVSPVRWEPAGKVKCFEGYLKKGSDPSEVLVPKCPEGKLIDQTGKEWACEKKCLGGECATVTDKNDEGFYATCSRKVYLLLCAFGDTSCAREVKEETFRSDWKGCKELMGARTCLCSAALCNFEHDFGDEAGEGAKGGGGGSAEGAVGESVVAQKSYLPAIITMCTAFLSVRKL